MVCAEEMSWDGQRLARPRAPSRTFCGLRATRCLRAPAGRRTSAAGVPLRARRDQPPKNLPELGRGVTSFCVVFWTSWYPGLRGRADGTVSTPGVGTDLNGQDWCYLGTPPVPMGPGAPFRLSPGQSVLPLEHHAGLHSLIFITMANSSAAQSDANCC